MANYTIAAPVGRNGKNHKADVLVVQRLLNHCSSMLIPVARLAEDGICGPNTIFAISLFQQRWVGHASADGRVDPGGRTLRKLNTSLQGVVPNLPLGQPPPPALTGGSTGRRMAWGAKVSPAFRAKVIDICAKLGSQPDDLMACMAFESAGTFSPSKRNAAGSGAVGLIQFMPSTARALKTETNALAAMTAEDQLTYVYQYFASNQRFTGKLGTIEDLYMAILCPLAVGQLPTYVLYSSQLLSTGRTRVSTRMATERSRSSRQRRACAR